MRNARYEYYKKVIEEISKVIPWYTVYAPPPTPGWCSQPTGNDIYITMVYNVRVHDITMTIVRDKDLKLIYSAQKYALFLNL